MNYQVPIVPISKNITKDNLFDNFDESSIINSPLNMAGFEIYNVKNPANDYDAVTKIYVDTKIYNINSANIVGNLPWSGISNIPDFFPGGSSSLLVDSNIDIGIWKLMKNGIEIIGLSNNSVITNYIVDNAVTNNKILGPDYAGLFGIPLFFNTKTSLATIDPSPDYGSSFLPLSSVMPALPDHLVNKQHVDSKTSGTVSPYDQVQPPPGTLAGPAGNATNPPTPTIGNPGGADAPVGIYGGVTNVANNPTNDTGAPDGACVDTSIASAVGPFAGPPPYPTPIHGWPSIYGPSSCTHANPGGINYVDYLYDKAPASCPSPGNGTAGANNHPAPHGDAPGDCHPKFNNTNAGLGGSLGVHPCSTSAGVCGITTVFIAHGLPTAATTGVSAPSFDNGSGGYPGYDSGGGDAVDTGPYGPACPAGSSNGHPMGFKVANGAGGPVVVGADTWLLACFSCAPVNGIMTCNAWLGGQPMLGGGPCPGQTASPPAWLGHNGGDHAGSDYNDRFNGDMGGALIHNGGPSGTERQDVEQYPKNKWILPPLYKNAGWGDESPPPFIIKWLFVITAGLGGLYIRSLGLTALNPTMSAPIAR